MVQPLSTLDWALIQAFLDVAETGSLSAAARKCGASQPTLGRRIRRAEQALGLTLFHRRARGLEPSDQARALLPAAREMRAAAGRLALTAAGQDGRPEGDVRVTASQVVSHFLLPPILARLRTEAPGIHIDLVPDDSTRNLLFREADIALRMYRPTQLDVIARHLGDMEIGIFAARSYLARRGHPDSIDAMLTHEFVGYDRDRRLIEGMARMGWQAGRDFFALRSDDQAAQWHLVRAGAGLGIGLVAVGGAEPDLVRLFPGLPIPPLPVWLVAHEAMRHTPRIRRVWQALEAGLAPYMRG